MGATELARVIHGAPTSVQNNLRLLATHGVVERGLSRFKLLHDHPAAAELVALGLRLLTPEAAIRLVLRANDSVEFAFVDAGGFVVGMRLNPVPESLEILESSLATIQRDRPDVPQVMRFDIDELARILHSGMGLRWRVLSADVLKGVVRPVGPPVAGGYARSPGSRTQIR